MSDDPHLVWISIVAANIILQGVALETVYCGGGGDQEARVGRDHQVSYGLSVDQIRFDGISKVWRRSIKRLEREEITRYGFSADQIIFAGSVL